MAAISTALLTVEEFLALPEVEGMRRELLHGEMLEMPCAGQRHEVVKLEFNKALVRYTMRHPVGEVLSETSYRMSTDKLLTPDVSLMFPERLKKIGSGHFRGAPELAVEVVSSESARTLQRKVDVYLSNGGLLVWAAYGDERLVIAHDRTGITRFRQDQRLEAPELLPGFSVPVSQFFVRL